LIEKDISVADLQRQAGYSANISTQLRNNSYVSLELMEKIYCVLTASWTMLWNLYRTKMKNKNVSTAGTIHERGFLNERT
jgi:hypothetical protein